MDVFDLPEHTSGKVWTFLPTDFTGTTPGWQAWTRPRGYSMLAAVCIGGGGGGAGGETGAAGTLRNGGGGGGASGIARAVFVADVLPGTLYLLVGRGGASVAANTAGADGQISRIAVAPDTVAANQLLLSGDPAATGGAADGSAGVGSTLGQALLREWGLFATVSGQDGTVGGQVAEAGTSVVLMLGTPSSITGGAGGGMATIANVNFDGGAITGAGQWPTSRAGIGANGGPGAAWHGLHGYLPRIGHGIGLRGVLLSLVSYGGSGGGSSATSGTAGDGGDGAVGAGGGGGGGGVTGGRGVAGGPGLIFLVAW